MAGGWMAISSPRWRPRVIIVMVKAGDPTDAVIDELAP